MGGGTVRVAVRWAVRVGGASSSAVERWNGGTVGVAVRVVVRWAVVRWDSASGASGASGGVLLPSVLAVEQSALAREPLQSPPPPPHQRRHSTSQSQRAHFSLLHHGEAVHLHQHSMPSTFPGCVGCGSDSSAHCHGVQRWPGQILGQ